MPETGYESILTVWTWPTIPWWLIAALLFGLIMAIAAIVNYARREPKPGTVTAILAVVAIVGSLLAYALLPNTDSVTETTHIIAEGTVTETQATSGDEPTLRLRLDTDPTWVLIFHGDDIDKLDGAKNVTAQCEWGTTTMDCTTEITGAARPFLVPWWAETKEMHAILLPALKE